MTETTTRTLWEVLKEVPEHGGFKHGDKVWALAWDDGPHYWLEPYVADCMVMDTGNIDEKRDFAEHEGMLGIGIMVIALLAVAYFCGINYARAHQEPQEKQSIESNVSDD